MPESSAARSDLSVLGVSVEADGVEAVIAVDGVEVWRGRAPVEVQAPQPGWAELPPVDLWSATLSAVRDALENQVGPPPQAVGLSGAADTLLLWDEETLGAPRPGFAAADRRTTDLCASLLDEVDAARVTELTGNCLDPRRAAPRLAWVARHEPHTWSLVESGRYVVGGAESYLLARTTRGTWHAADVSVAAGSLLYDVEAGGWSDELTGLFGVPRLCLPDVVATTGRLGATDPRSFLDLEAPVTGLCGERAAALVVHGCHRAGSALLVTEGEGWLLVVGGPSPGPAAAMWTRVPLWRDAEGTTTYGWLTEGRTADGPDDAALALSGIAGALSGVDRVLVEGPVSDEVCQEVAGRLGTVVRRVPRHSRALGAALLAGVGAAAWADLGSLPPAATSGDETTFGPG